MGLSSGPSRSRYVPPSPAMTGARDIATAIAQLVEDRVRRAAEIRTAVARTGCDGLPLINPLDGTTCAPIGGQMKLTHGGWLFEARVPRNLGGAGGSPAILSETILPTACEQQRSAWNSRLRFLDSVGNLWGPGGAWISKGNTPATLPLSPWWYVRGGEGGLTFAFKDADTGVSAADVTSATFNLAMGMMLGAGRREGACAGVNAGATCYGAPNSDLVLTCEVGNFDEINRAGSHALTIRSATTLLTLGQTLMQYAASNHYYAMDQPPHFAISATEDGSWWVHLFGGEALEGGTPSPWPNWEYVTPVGVGAADASAPGVGNTLIQRVTVDRATMKPSFVESRYVTMHAEMEPWEDDTFVTAYLVEEGV